MRSFSQAFLAVQDKQGMNQRPWMLSEGFTYTSSPWIWLAAP